MPEQCSACDGGQGELFMMGMNSSMMVGANGAGMMFFGWVLYILLVLLLVFGIAALWKYLQK